MTGFQFIKDFLSVQILSNTVQDYLVSIFTMVGLVLGFSVTKQIFIARIKGWLGKTHSSIDGILIGVLKSFGAPAFLVTALYISTLSLELQETLRSIIRYAFVIVVTISGLRLLQDTAAYAIEKAYRRARPDDLAADMAIRNLRTVVGWAGETTGLARDRQESSVADRRRHFANSGLR